MAVELLEDVLEGLGGRRVGGPRKAVAGGGAAAVATAAAAAAPEAAAGVIAAMAARLGIGSSSGGGGAGTAAAPAKPPEDEPASSSSAAAVAAAVAGTSSDELSAAAGAPKPRADEGQLGYRHVGEWQLLWTKSVYGIKAARAVRPGQVVSAVAGLNSLTMKKRMIATLKTVRQAVSVGFGWFRLVFFNRAASTMLAGACTKSQAILPSNRPISPPPPPPQQCLGLELAGQVAPLSFCLPEELPQWREWLQRHPDKDTGLWMLKTGQDAGKGLRLVPTCG